MVTFEDRVIFVHDMESCLQRLSDFSLQLIARHTLQEHDLEATARLLQCNEKTIRRAIPVALDQLSEILLEVGLLEKMNPTEENSCQGGQSDEILASDCEESEKIHDYSLDTNDGSSAPLRSRDRAHPLPKMAVLRLAWIRSRTC